MSPRVKLKPPLESRQWLTCVKGQPYEAAYESEFKTRTIDQQQGLRGYSRIVMCVPDGAS